MKYSSLSAVHCPKTFNLPFPLGLNLNPSPDLSDGGCLHGGRKILEGGTTFHWVCMQKFRSVWSTEEKELKI